MPAARTTKPAASKELVVKFEFERETKNATRYQEVLEGRERGVVGTLYVLTSDLAKIGKPESITVTITAS